MTRDKSTVSLFLVCLQNSKKCRCLDSKCLSCPCKKFAFFILLRLKNSKAIFEFSHIRWIVVVFVVPKSVFITTTKKKKLRENWRGLLKEYSINTTKTREEMRIFPNKSLYYLSIVKSGQKRLLNRNFLVFSGFQVNNY